MDVYLLTGNGTRSLTSIDVTDLMFGILLKTVNLWSDIGVTSKAPEPTRNARDRSFATVTTSTDPRSGEIPPGCNPSTRERPNGSFRPIAEIRATVIVRGSAAGR